MDHLIASIADTRAHNSGGAARLRGKSRVCSRHGSTRHFDRHLCCRRDGGFGRLGAELTIPGSSVALPFGSVQKVHVAPAMVLMQVDRAQALK